jgi:hypothetical protein
VLQQQAMPVPAVIVPVYTMGMAREGTCRLEQMLPKREVATCVCHTTNISNQRRRKNRVPPFLPPFLLGPTGTLTRAPSPMQVHAW